MSSFGGGAAASGGRARVGVPVYLNIYDLTPANQVLYHVGLGAHHSGVEIMGAEYTFASGAGIFDMPPKQVPGSGAVFREQVLLGHASGGMQAVNRALDHLRTSFGPQDYSLIRKNCNHFANAFSYELLNKPIPDHVNRLAILGQCCSCLLPKHMIEHAPVGDTLDDRGYSVQGNRAAASAAAVSKNNVMAFRGAGHKLGSEQGGGAQNSILGLVPGVSSIVPSASKKPQDDVTDRRERARKAALARLERQQQQSPSSSDKSR